MTSHCRAIPDSKEQVAHCRLLKSCLLQDGTDTADHEQDCAHFAHAVSRSLAQAHALSLSQLSKPNQASVDAITAGKLQPYMTQNDISCC